MNENLARLLTSAIPSTIAAAAAWFASKAHRGISEVHLMVNSRLTELLQATTQAALLKGKAEADAIQLVHVADVAAQIVLDTAASKAKGVVVVAKDAALGVVDTASEVAKNL